MMCPGCSKGDTKVRLSVPFVEGGVPKVVRDRVCPLCGYSFHTIEVPESKPAPAKEPEQRSAKKK
jgi:transcriptional regulator NrdR family protein